MRNKWLALVICAIPLIAAEKNRNWQSGQVVESKALDDPRDHAIASADKIYLVRGSIAGAEDALAVGATLRFAVEDKNLFISIAGKEYKLYLLGVRTATTKPAATDPAAVASPPPTPPAPNAHEVVPRSETVDKTLNETLNNDAIVKMIVGGLKEDTVVGVIEARPGKYILTPDALAALKAAGVSQGVIAAMSAKAKAQR